VALAEREGCELVTADQKSIKNLAPYFPFIVPLASPAVKYRRAKRRTGREAGTPNEPRAKQALER
jgi:hypothetical protein